MSLLRDALIVSTARTPIGRAYRGAFDATPAPTLAAHAVRAAVERAGVDPAAVEDCVLGCGMPQGNQHTIGRTAALRAGLPVTVPGMTMDRQCASGLMAIATAAKQIVIDRMDVVIAGGVESISLVQTPNLRVESDTALMAMHHDIYMPMLDTAETVARRYGVSRERQNAYGLRSQRLTAEAQVAGRHCSEIVATTAIKRVQDKATGQIVEQEVTLTADEGAAETRSPMRVRCSMSAGVLGTSRPTDRAKAPASVSSRGRAEETSERSGEKAGSSPAGIDCVVSASQR